MKMSQNTIELSIIIVNWNTKQLLLDCLASLYKYMPDIGVEIFVVDNASTDDSVDAVSRSFPDAQVIVNAGNWGFARANNVAIKRMRGKYAVLLNSDTLLKESTLQGLHAFMEKHPVAGMCGPQLLNADGSKQKSTGEFPKLFEEFVSKSIIRFVSLKKKTSTAEQKKNGCAGPRPVDFILGACMMVRKAAIDAVGMLDEDYFFLYEEIDWCYRMHRSGWRVYHLPEVSLYHLGGQSMREINLQARVESWRSRYLFFRKSLNLNGVAWFALLTLGLLNTVYQFLLYSLFNAVTLFTLKRLRRRWEMFAYLLAWHLRGRPMSMGIPR